MRGGRRGAGHRSEGLTTRAQEKANLMSALRQKNALIDALEAVKASEAAAQLKAEDLSSALAKRVYRHARGVSLSWPMLAGPSLP